MLVDVLALPRDRPATVEAAQRVGVGAGDEDLARRHEGQRTVVLQQHNALAGGFKGLVGMLLTGKEGEVLPIIIRCIEEARAILQAQHAARGIVDAAHRHLALLHQLLQQGAEVPAVGIHRHVDAGVDGDADGLFLRCSDVVAAPEVHDVGPVGHNHAVPLQVVLQPLRQVLIVGVQGHAVVALRVHHHRERTVAHGLQERGEVLLAHLLRRDVRRRAVLAARRHAVAHVVLHASGHMPTVYVVGVVALKA